LSQLNKHFTAHRSYDSAVLGVVILSVCSSLCLPQACFVTNRTTHCRYFDTTRRDDHCSFLTPTVVGGRRTFRLKFALKVTLPFEKRTGLLYWSMRRAVSLP